VASLEITFLSLGPSSDLEAIHSIPATLLWGTVTRSFKTDPSQRLRQFIRVRVHTESSRASLVTRRLIMTASCVLAWSVLSLFSFLALFLEPVNHSLRNLSPSIRYHDATDCSKGLPISFLHPCSPPPLFSFPLPRRFFLFSHDRLLLRLSNHVSLTTLSFSLLPSFLQ
jgi:hypothetical protein